VKNYITKFLQILYPLLVFAIAITAWMIKGEGVSFGALFQHVETPVMIPEIQYCYGACLGNSQTEPATIPAEIPKHTSVFPKNSFSDTI
jgi:hypothetical protein